MGWIKGTPRKGHVNKNGKPHAAWGDLITTLSEKQATPTFKRVTKKHANVVREFDTKPTTPEMTPEKMKQWRSLLTHPTGPFVVFCPNCGFPEADGGFCINCGWSLPIKIGRVS